MYPSKGTRLPGPVNARPERLDELAGERGDDRAVMQSDTAELGTIAILSRRVTAAPTAAEHNALVEDLHAIASMLNRMGAKFTGL